MEPVKEEEYKGYTIYIYQDEDPENPRQWDNLGEMVCAHKRYELGDKQINTKEEIDNLQKKVARKDVIALPLYLMDHSGLWINTSGFSHVDPQRWDWGQLGYILVDFAKVRKEYNVKRVTKAIIAKVKEVLESEVETFNQYLTGDVYGYKVLTNKGDYFDDCWGNYGLDETLKYVKDEIDAFLANKESK